MCAQADVLIAAIGRAEMIAADYIKPGAAVIDVGINRTNAGLKGDVKFEAAAEEAGLISRSGRCRPDDDRDAAA